jgi:hypothetical protein
VAASPFFHLRIEGDPISKTPHTVQNTKTTDKVQEPSNTKIFLLSPLSLDRLFVYLDRYSSLGIKRP